MDKASLAVQYVFGFTLLAGVTVLLAAIQATRDERRYESAMLRTLGASRRVVLQGVAAEFTTLGLLAGTLAAIGATAAGYFLATRRVQSRLHVRPGVWGVGLVAGALLVGLSGTLATRSVVNHPRAAVRGTNWRRQSERPQKACRLCSCSSILRISQLPSPLLQPIAPSRPGRASCSRRS